MELWRTVKRLILSFFFKSTRRKRFNMYGDQYPFMQPKYPAELREIADKIAGGKPAISWDDILDFFLALKKEEGKKKPRSKKKAPAKKRPPKKERRVTKNKNVIRENDIQEIKEVL